MTAPNKPASKKKLDLKVKRVQKLKTNVRGGASAKADDTGSFVPVSDSGYSKTAASAKDSYASR